jgi:hypothetical protein
MLAQTRAEQRRSRGNCGGTGAKSASMVSRRWRATSQKTNHSDRNCATKGKTVYEGRSIPMEKLDHLVTEHLMERLFKPERLAAIR